MADIWPVVGEIRSKNGPEASAALIQSPTQCFCYMINLFSRGFMSL